MCGTNLAGLPARLLLSHSAAGRWVILVARSSVAALLRAHFCSTYDPLLAVRRQNGEKQSSLRLPHMEARYNVFRLEHADELETLHEHRLDVRIIPCRRRFRGYTRARRAKTAVVTWSGLSAIFGSATTKSGVLEV